MDYIIYEVENLERARIDIAKIDRKIILVNKESAIKYYGTLVLDKILKNLTQEFPQKIIDSKFNIADCDWAFFSLIKLGYTSDQIIYSGKSKFIKDFLYNFCK